MPEQKSYIKNCHIVRRASDDSAFLFKFPDGDMSGHCIVRLDGYAIVPIEEYARLTAEERS